MLTSNRKSVPVMIVTLGIFSAGSAFAQNAPITLSLDATDAPRKILHARETLPVKPGAFTLVYPKWIPGEHGPTGPIINFAGLKLTAGGKPVAWRRDGVDMYAFHCDIPQGETMLEAEFDFLLPSDAPGFSSGASSTAQLAVLSWNQVLLYPQGTPSDKLTVAASMKIPAGWKYGTALPVAADSSDSVTFQPASLTTLVDSPVLTGANFKRIELSPGQTPPHYLDMVSDSASALEMSAEQIGYCKNLVQEAGSLFGARHYRDYHFLLTLSDHVAHFGLEHHESSDDRVDEKTVTDTESRGVGGLLAHEFTHSWNGKFRRPSGLATSDYQQPMQGELLWVYEGLTEYYGEVLSARSGFYKPQRFRDNLARLAARLDHQVGRTWRPLQDTTVAAQLLYDAPGEWYSYRRGTDFYDEGELIWLEADVLIRQQTQGKKSLDDFCKRFHGGQSLAPNAVPMVKPYTFDELTATLNAVAPYDWKTFFTTRLNSTDAHAPFGGIEKGGWKVVYDDKASDSDKKARRDGGDLAYTLGINTNDDGVIGDVTMAMPAAKAGLGPGMKIVAVNGRKFTSDLLKEAVTASKTATEPIEFLIENGEFYKTYRLDYHGGDQFPHLERDAAIPDVIADIIKATAK